MTDNEAFPIDGLLALEPSPDEEAWEAFLVFALEHMGAGQEEMAIDMATLRKLEKAIGVQLPFEVGLLLVIGVPYSDDWIRWGEDPAAEYLQWSGAVVERVVTDLEATGRWPEAWGERPQSADERAAAVRHQHDAGAPLLPLTRTRVVPLAIADGEETSESNPILSIDGATVTTVATDMAAWLNAEFDVPLPMWPETAPRRFPFWSDLADRE